MDRPVGEVLYHLKGSFDGVPDPDNPFLEHYVPWCVQSPLLVHTSLYIAAQPLAERRFLDETTTTRIKVHAIHVLNEHLRTAATCTGDEAMAAVAQFMTIEFYYGTSAAMRAHLQGFRQMVLLRGGFSTSRQGALVTKVALVTDCITALALEAVPLLQATRPAAAAAFPHAYDEPPPPAFRLAHSSPLLAPRLPFSICIASLGLHPATAWLLDEMAFLIHAVLALPAQPAPRDLATLRSTAAWTLARVRALPVDAPDDAAAAIPAPAAHPHGMPSAPGASCQHSTDDPPKPHSLLPRYPQFAASERGFTPPPRPRADGPGVAGGVPRPLHPPAGPLYTAVRLTACIYARAILARTPLSRACSDAEALAVLAASWRIPLDRWRGVVGVFVFVMAALVPALHQRSDRPGGAIRAHVHTRFAKAILQIGLMNVSLMDWPACHEMMSRSLRLQRWLGEGDEGREGAAGEAVMGGG